MKKINVAIIGLGYWGPNLLRNFFNLRGVNVLYACDLKDKNLKKISGLYTNVKKTKDYREILKDERVDLVAIATPTKSHYSLAKDSLIAKKHVLLEKPMTATCKEALELISLSKKIKRKIFVDHTFVYTEAIQEIKKIIDGGTLGKIYYYDSTRINLGLISADSNVIWDLAPHDLSIINYLFPYKAKSLQAFGSSFINGESYELAHLIIRYFNGFIAHIHVSWLSPVKIRSVLIGGSKRMISYNDIEPSEKVKIYNKSISIKKSEVTTSSPAYRSGDVIIPHIKQKEALEKELNHFMDCLRKNKKPLTGHEEGLEVVRILEAAGKALKTKTLINL